MEKKMKYRGLDAGMKINVTYRRLREGKMKAKMVSRRKREVLLEFRK